MREIDEFFLNVDEPAKGCLLALREFILRSSPEVTEVWRYKMPFYCFHGKRFCYLWIQKKSGLPYIGFVDGKKLNHPKLLKENRSRMKIMLIDPERDIPVGELRAILRLAMELAHSR